MLITGGGGLTDEVEALVFMTGGGGGVTLRLDVDHR